MSLGWNQLSAANGCAERRFGQGAEGRLHAGQHDSRQGGVGETGPEVRSDVCKTSFRSLVSFSRLTHSFLNCRLRLTRILSCANYLVSESFHHRGKYHFTADLLFDWFGFSSAFFSFIFYLFKKQYIFTANHVKMSIQYTVTGFKPTTSRT